ncbi:MAG: polyprenyl synthetase family protein [Desulfobulbaceae bacterium]|uniref:Polyprenyl synthetase family protein n=1 Tax=Candidatus Desulfatifera sulfidica TaxID=2841691 RepID=A0A8J6TEA4_9BACT|nr:polyprenyl synthetase family protein [Candidatus Desulfatifera sulfidica]
MEETTATAEKSGRERLLKLVRPDMERVEAAMRRDIEELSADMAPLLREILDYGLFGGGKRIRPLLTVLSWRLCGGRDMEIERLAMAFEYLHAATLFHDDVIDRSHMRRGRPAVNSVYGEVGAILAGDFLHARSMALVGELGGMEAMSVFCRATAAMIDGEFLQLANAREMNLSEENYFAVIRGKTAYLIAAACEIGGLAAGIDTTRQEGLRRYGLNLGAAFQIIDDLLDYRGDPQKTGKAVGNDFVEGKMSLPLILALDMAGDSARERLLELLVDEESRRSGVAEATAIMEECGAFDKTAQRAKALIVEAMTGLPEAASDEALAARLGLELLGGYVLNRQK